MNVFQKELGYIYKIIILGPGGVGKTCLFNRYCFNSFNMNTEMTLGINFHSTHIPIEVSNGNGEPKDIYVTNSIFDLAGQDRFKRLIPKFMEGANGALLMFDMVSYTSFQQLEYWYGKLFKNLSISDIPVLLIGGKSDLLDQVHRPEIVDEHQINEFVKEKNLDGFLMTSSKENQNVLEVFRELTDLMLKANGIEARFR